MGKTVTSVKRRKRRRLRMGVLLVLGFVFGWYGVGRLISPWAVTKRITLDAQHQVARTDAFGTLRVGCYNIAHGRGGRLGARNWDGGDHATKLARLEQIADLLRSADLDLLVLNEADFDSFWSGHVDQARLIAEHLGYPYLLELRNIDMTLPFVRVRHGSALLSKYPLSDVTFLDYPNVSKLAEIFIGGIKEGVAVTVELPDASQVRVVVVHLSHNSAAVRVASARMILDEQRRAAMPFIALGDFNSTPLAYPLSESDAAGDNAIEVLLASGQLTTLPMGLPVDPSDFTFYSQQPNQVIDWVFASAPWRLVDKQVLTSDLSDHFPVIVKLTRQGDE